MDASYYLADLLSDHIGNEKTGLLYTELQRKKKLVSEITAYITGSLDNGLLVITGKLNPGRTFEQLDAALWQTLDKYTSRPISKSALKELLLKMQTAKAFQDQGLLNRAMNLCFFELLGDAHLLNQEPEHYQQVKPIELQQFAKAIFRKNHCSLLQIQAK